MTSGSAPACRDDRLPAAPAPPAAPETVLAALAAALPGVTLRVRRSRRTLLSLYRDRAGTRVGLDPRLLSNPESSVLIPEWVRRGGRGGAGNGLRSLLAEVQRASIATRLAEVPAELVALPTVPPGLDLQAALATVHGRWFADLPLPQVGWARQAHRRLSAIRFGCYRRAGGGTISIHPRLALPWVAQVFLAHVIFHELCHHRQACQPLRGRERVHSPRFRAWERAFPSHAQALAWERAALPCLLDGTPPPWYRPAAGAPP